ncbi:MAG: hypothetical protein HQ508_01770 [Candidatus Marinimicrobia bacterium]|nr:hypothetical protein [Candidatus Neomarinimicrobiota bacterium]
MIQLLTHHKRQIVLPILAVVGLVSCDLLQEPKLPTWTNSVEFPLIKTSVNLETLKDQDNIKQQLYENGDSIYAYVDTTAMASQEVGDQLAFGDITKTFSQSVDDVTVTGSNINQTSGFDPVGVAPIQELIESALGVIELANIPATSTDPFLLNEIVPSVNDLPDGNAVIPGGDLEPVYKPFSFTDFSSADFSGGTLDITINNGMVISLGQPINIQLQEVNGPDTIDIVGGSVNWSAPIAPGTNSTRSLDLTGITLPGNILVLVTGSTIGSDGSSIPIDNAARISSFNIDISGTSLMVTSATAKVPSQSINESGSITMAESENIIQSARIKVGSLKIEIANAMTVPSTLDISIASLEDPSSIAFSTTVQIPANSTIADVSDISGYSLVMSTDNQEVLYSYEINTEDTGGNLVTLAETDQVSVTIALYGDSEAEDLYFGRMTGIIEAQNIEDGGEIAISSKSNLLSADISSGSLSITIDNQINASGFAGLPTITLTIPELLDASSNALSGNLTLEANPIENILTFDLSDYNLVFPDTSAQVLTYTTLVTTPIGEVGRYGLEDSIFVSIVVSDLEFSTITGFFSQDAIIDSSNIELDEGTKLIEAIFESGSFALSMTNRIGAVADVEFQIDEFIHRSSSQPLQMSFRLEDVSTPQISTLDLSDYMLVFPSAVAGETQGIHYVSTVSLPSDEEMTLTFGDSIIIDVNITELAMESVTGIIEPDTLTIDPDTVSFALPDMVSDLKFERVNIDIDFNSTFEVPIDLNLILTGTDSLGYTETINVSHTLTPGDDIVHIDVADILNIHPEYIITSGTAIVGDGITESTVAKGQGMHPTMYINVPLSLIIDNPPSIDIDESSIDSPLPSDNTVTLREIVLFTDVQNMFEFGATIVVLASNDSLSFDSLATHENPTLLPDTLLSLNILPEERTNFDDPKLIELTEDKLNLFESKLFLKPEVYLLGRTDGPSRFFTTDSMIITIWGSVSYTVHGEEF